MVLQTQFCPHCAFETLNLENYFHLSICMLLGQCVHTLCFWYTLKPPIWIFLHLSIFILLRAMCSHMVLLTQFYHHSAFQTPNQEYSGYLSIFMLRRAMCAHLVPMTKFYSQCAFETQNLQIYFHLKQSHAPQKNACKLPASDAILPLSCIWNSQSRKLSAF